MKLACINSYSVQRINKLKHSQNRFAQRFYHLSGNMALTSQKKRLGLIDNDEAAALRKINNPRGETKLHYAVVSYIRRNYPHVLITPGLGENQITHFSLLDSKAKGYRKGQPDLALKCKRRR